LLERASAVVAGVPVAGDQLLAGEGLDDRLVTVLPGANPVPRLPAGVRVRNRPRSCPLALLVLVPGVEAGVAFTNLVRVLGAPCSPPRANLGTVSGPVLGVARDHLLPVLGVVRRAVLAPPVGAFGALRGPAPAAAGATPVPLALVAGELCERLLLAALGAGLHLDSSAEKAAS